MGYDIVLWFREQITGLKCILSAWHGRRRDVATYKATFLIVNLASTWSPTCRCHNFGTMTNGIKFLPLFDR